MSDFAQSITLEEIEEQVKLKFPSHKKFNDGQFQIIMKILSSFLIDGNKFYILEAPTGIGKSVIAKTVANVINYFTVPNSKIITCNRLLQRQYSSDFDDMKNIESSKHYDCAISLFKGAASTHYNDIDCGGRSCPSIGRCDYFNAFNAFINAPTGITNYAYYLMNAEINSNLLIADEAHNMESLICTHYSIELESEQVNGLFKYMKKIQVDNESASKIRRGFLEMRSYISGQTENLFFLDDFIYNIGLMYKRLTSEILKHKRGSKTTLIFSGKEDHLSKCKSHIEYLKRLEVLLQIFRSNPSSYIKMYSIENNGSEDLVKAILKPLEPRHIARILFDRSKYVLLMSATICGVEEFAANLGITNFGFDCLSSPFPVENRLIMLHNLEGLNNGNFSQLVDLYIQKMDEILDFHIEDRGLIHTVSYSNQKLIESKSRHAKRFILPKRGELFNINKLKSTKNGILLSPSMTEGVDLADDLSRFQIIFKMPFANLGDKWIKKKMELSYVWYLIQVARTFSQACGRSVRHKEDSAITHVIDGNINKIQHLLPKYIQEALKEDN